MRLERSKFVKICFHKKPFNNVVGYYKHLIESKEKEFQRMVEVIKSIEKQ